MSSSRVTREITDWLSDCIDVNVSITKQTLDEMDEFRNQNKKTFIAHYLYARGWCNLSNFLYANKDKDLYSTCPNMSFEVPEKQSSVNVYWFEVLRAADMLNLISMSDIIRDLRLGTAKESYAAIAPTLNKDKCTTASQHIRLAIGVCKYLLSDACSNCPLLEINCPETIKLTKRRYKTFRVIGSWLQAWHFLFEEKNYTQAHKWFVTCERLSVATIDSVDITDAALPMLHSCGFLKVYCLAYKALGDNSKGVAIAHLRKARAISNGKFEGMLEELTMRTTISLGEIAPAVPDDTHPLVCIKVEPVLTALLCGKDPLNATQLFFLRQGS